MAGQDEFLSFLDDPDEASLSATAGSSQRVWRVLIVDDDPDVHEATEFALRDAIMQNRPLQFLHTYSGEDALILLQQEPDIAVVLLDVVMETEDAGLRIIQTIRTDLGLTNTRIILRTGQPGYAPEIDTIHRYDINDYKTKSELVRGKLYITLTAAIRCYEQLCRMDAQRRGLEQVVAASNQFVLEQGLQAFAESIITQMAKLAHIEPHGVVCVSVSPNSAHDDNHPLTPPTIIAALGRYRHLIEQALSDLEDARVVEHLTGSLTQRCHRIAEDSLTLFLPGREGHDFVVFIDATEPFDEIDAHLLEVFCVNMALCADNVALVSRLRDYAFVDQQVRLPNRTAFINFIDQRLKETARQQWAIALVDVDQFAEINDMLGHSYGDRLLDAIARRLEQPPLDQCQIARVAGDKFGIFGEERLVQPNILQPLLAAPFEIEDGEHTITISTGFVRLSEHSGRGAELIKDASIALKHAKANGFGQIAYYSDTISTETRERTRLLHDLRRAFDHDHLFVVYQPQISLSDHRVIGFEALLRWRNDEGQFVPPDRFIPVAERSGMIISLGRWVLHTALMALKQLQIHGYTGLRMAVNVSAVQFRQPQFLQMVLEALRDTGIRPGDVELEITESVAALGFDYVENLLGQLKNLGICIAIDDFGTGFSSLSYLDRLPADRLKIDKSFVWALDSQQTGARIAEIVIELGRKLGMNILAEGVETLTQATLLRDLGCDDAQGYYFGKPMLLSDLLDWLTARTSALA